MPAFHYKGTSHERFEKARGHSDPEAIEDRGAIPLVAGPKEVQRGTSNERETIGKAHAVPPVPLVTKTAAMPGVRDFICSRANRSLRGLQAAPDYRISVFVTGNGFAHGHSVEW